MVVSYNWLQTYFKEKLPPPQKVVETLIFHAFEVESIEQKGDDWIFDIKVLPDRAHDCLSHRGIARELAVHLRTHIIEEKKHPVSLEGKPVRTLSVDVREPKLCRRYAGRVIESVQVGPSPQWLRERLESIGQKSINNIVDATNFVMFDLGQPLHAFDAAKLSERIVVRKAVKGERVTTLDGKECELDQETLIIADDKHPLAIAGVKGGKQAEITATTTSIVLEAANFSPVQVRKTSKKLGIQTDSSKRFENERTPEGISEVLDAATALIVEIAGSRDTHVGEIVDAYPRRGAPYTVGISVNEANRVLGTDLSRDDIDAIFTRAGWQHRFIETPVGEILGRASALIGVPYQFGASVVYDAPRAFDCSSFLAYLFSQAGVQLPRMAVDQYAFGEKVEKQDLKPGDLVFSNTGNGKIYYETVEWLRGTKIPEGVDHCGLYVGEGNIIHATRVAGKVVMGKLSESAQFKTIAGFRRISASTPRFLVTVPAERLDLRIPEDLIDDIGKIYGYENIAAKTLPELPKKPAVSKEFFYTNKIKNILLHEGFSELYTSSFREKGDIALENPIAADKGFLRNNLTDGMTQSLEMNGKNAPLLGADMVKAFEIGNVFLKKEGEKLVLAVGVYGKGGQKILEDTVQHLQEALNLSKLPSVMKTAGNTAVTELKLGELLAELSEPESYKDVLTTPGRDVVYKKISTYPFILRDVAVFVPSHVVERDIVSIVIEKAGKLLAREPKLFDRFEKKHKETGEIEKVSYAFRLVFQSEEKTLSDDEINVIMDSITRAINSNSGWQVR